MTVASGSAAPRLARRLARHLDRGPDRGLVGRRLLRRRERLQRDAEVSAGGGVHAHQLGVGDVRVDQVGAGGQHVAAPLADRAPGHGLRRGRRRRGRRGRRGLGLLRRIRPGRLWCSRPSRPAAAPSRRRPPPPAHRPAPPAHRPAPPAHRPALPAHRPALPAHAGLPAADRPPGRPALPAHRPAPAGPPTGAAGLPTAGSEPAAAGPSAAGSPTSRAGGPPASASSDRPCRHTGTSRSASPGPPADVGDSGSGVGSGTAAGGADRTGDSVSAPPRSTSSSARRASTGRARLTGSFSSIASSAGTSGPARSYGVGRLLHDLGQRLHRVAAGERRPPLDRRVQRGAETPHVGRRARRQALDDLRRDVRRRADQQPRTGDRVVPGRPGDAEVGELHPPVVPEQDVARLDVAVGDAGRVRRLQRAEDGQPDGRHPQRVQRAVLLDHLGQRPGRHQLHDHPGPGVLVQDVEQGDHVGVAEPGDRACLAQCPLAADRPLLRRQAAGKNDLLHRDRPAQERVLGLPDRTHRAATEHALQVVAPGEHPPPGTLAPWSDHGLPSCCLPVAHRYAPVTP